MGSTEEESKKRRVVGAGGAGESLGWLTESTIMPKKHKAIEGVGASSIMELKAELYKSQEESKKSKPPDADYHRAKSKVGPNDPFSRKNSGVDSRAHLDKLALKAVSEGSASYEALEKKAQLYDKLVRGELSDEEDKEKYCVDFFRKGLTQDEIREQQNDSSSSTEVPRRESNEDGDFVPFSLKPRGLGRNSGTVDWDDHLRFVKEVHEEASQAREQVSELKLRRQEVAAARREKLKQAYLKKKLEQLKAAAATKQENT